MSSTMLPLFPLGVVLFPGSALPLHIFEERYKLLVGQSSQTGAEFGVNLTENGNLSEVGCTARVRDVVRRFEDGSFDVIVDGIRRYDLLEFHKDRAPYYVGTVVFREPSQEERDRALLSETLALYNKLVRVVYKDGRFVIDEEEADQVHSYRIAQKVGLDLATRQHLLEVDSENERLELLRAYLKDFLPRLENAAEVDKVARNDGYVS
ncbi:MAG: LON peptidase substrate-binding domain-containing protein [Ignavibacteria bacterium]|nr:LON peptidase substrate-binding domain-containing protein [Ignavibacteria bacterium]